jgi:thioredoxin reductase
VSDAHPTVVIGAGPYGLSLAAFLRAKRVPLRVFGATMAAWEREMPRGMQLKSEPFASSIADPRGELTLERYYREHDLDYRPIGDPVPVERFVAYGHWFRERAAVPVEDRRVSRVSASPAGFDVELEGGDRVAAARVVVATGAAAFAHVPGELDGLPPELVSHVSRHDDLTRFHGRRVAVVGGGQSALETATILAENGAAPILVARTTALRWNGPPPTTRRFRSKLRRPNTPLGQGWPTVGYVVGPGLFRRRPLATRAHVVRTALGPAGAWWLRERFESRVDVRVDARMVAAEKRDDGVLLRLRSGEGEETVEVHHVIASTGYRVDLDRLELLAPDLRRAVRTALGAPLLSSRFESSVPGLYFVGLPAALSFGPLLRFVCGTRFTSRRVAAHAGRR